MNPIIRFRVDGIPKGQPRPRAFAMRVGNKFSARVFDSGSAEGWKGCVALAARPHLPASPWEGPIRLAVTFYFPRPKSLMRKRDPDGAIPHTGKPDVDNAIKSLLDAMTQIGFWRDDAQVCEVIAAKLIAAKGGSPGALVVVERIESAASPAATKAADDAELFAVAAGGVA